MQNQEQGIPPKPPRWPLLAWGAALLMAGIWVSDLLAQRNTPVQAQVRAATQVSTPTGQEVQPPSAIIPSSGQPSSTPTPLVTPEPETASAVSAQAPASTSEQAEAPPAAKVEMIATRGQVQKILRSERGFLRIVVAQENGDEITLTAMPSLGVLDPMPGLGDTIEATGLPTTYRGQPQVKLEDRHAITVLAQASTMDSSAAAAQQGPVQVDGRITSHREYEASNGPMLLFTLDNTLKGVMFASVWSQADRAEILRLAEEGGTVRIEGKMTTYRGEPSLQAQSIVAVP